MEFLEKRGFKNFNCNEWGFYFDGFHEDLMYNLIVSAYDDFFVVTIEMMGTEDGIHIHDCIDIGKYSEQQTIGIIDALLDSTAYMMGDKIYSFPFREEKNQLKEEDCK